MKKRSAVILFLLSALLSGITVHAGSKINFRDKYRDHLVIPGVIGKAPVIDGNLDDAAWQSAASLFTVRHALQPASTSKLPPHRMLAVYDRDNLYIGVETIFPAGEAIIRGDVRTADKEPEVYGSESFEFYLHINKITYRFGGNFAGGYNESSSVNTDWNGKWSYITTSKQQIDDTILWQCEVVIPWKTVGLTAPPKGDVPFNFCRSWYLSEVSTYASLADAGYSEVAGFGTLRLAEKSPVMRMTGHTDPNEGDYRQDLQLFSPDGGKVNYQVEMIRLDGKSPSVMLTNRDIELTPGKVNELKLAMNITAPGFDMLICRLSSGKELLFRQAIPFKLNNRLFDIDCSFMAENVEISFKRGKFASFANKDFTMKIFSPKGKVCGRFKVDSDKYDFKFPRSMAAGTYRAELFNGGKVVDKAEFFYPGIGEWEKLSIDTTRIIPPFTPMTYRKSDNGITGSLCGRDYIWQKSLFPEQIVSKGEKMLDGPIVLVGNGKALSGSRFTVKDSKPHRMDFSAAGSNGEFSAEVEGFLEYDGTLFNRVRLTAVKDLDELTLQIRMPASMATLVHASGSTSAWGSKLTDFVKEGTRVLNFHPTVWLGMQERGLSFFAESRYNWRSKPENSYTIEKRGDVVTLLVHLGKNIPAGKVMDVEFGFIATPVRPLSKNYPLDLFSVIHAAPINLHSGKPMVKTIMIPGDESFGSIFGDLPAYSSPATLKRREKAARDVIANGAIPIPYSCDRFISNEYPEMNAFIKDWAIEPNRAIGYTFKGVKYFTYDCCPASSSADFYLWKCALMFKRFPYGGIYFDFGRVLQCNNRRHGCRQRIPIMAMRDFYRKLMLLMLDLGIKEPKIVLHNTDYVRMPEMSFVTYFFNGENIRQQSSSILHDGKDILDTYELPMFAGELSSLTFGVTNSAYFPHDVLAKKYGGGKEPGQLYVFRVTKAALAGTLVHNTIISPHRCHYGTFSKIVRIYDRFGVPDSEFIGYWKNNVKVDGAKDIYVSYYRHPSAKKILAVVSHIGKSHDDQTFSLSFDPEKSGFTPVKAVDLLNAPDPEYGELVKMIKAKKLPHYATPTDLGDYGVSGVKVSGGKVILSLKHHSFALLEISGE